MTIPERQKRRWRYARPAAMLAVAAGLGCSTDVAAPPSNFGGIQYTASVAGVSAGTGHVPLLNAIVTLQNTAGVVQTRTYPLSCPVRIQLYRLSDNALMYDESKLPCDMTTTGTLTIPGLASTTLSSGVRFPGNIAGDTLPLVTYTVRVLVLTEGTKQVLINAGSFNLVSGPTG